MLEKLNDKVVDNFLRPSAPTRRDRRRSHSPQKKKDSLKLTVSPVALGVVALPGLASAGAGLVEEVALVDTTGLLAGSGETTSLAVLFVKKHVSNPRRL